MDSRHSWRNGWAVWLAINGWFGFDFWLGHIRGLDSFRSNEVLVCYNKLALTIPFPVTSHSLPITFVFGMFKVNSFSLMNLYTKISPSVLLSPDLILWSQKLTYLYNYLDIKGCLGAFEPSLEQHTVWLPKAVRLQIFLTSWQALCYWKWARFLH